MEALRDKFKVHGFAKAYLDRLESLTFSRPRCFIDAKGKSCLSLEFHPTRPLLVIMFEGVIGFKDIHKVDKDTMEERLYTRMSVKSNLTILSDLYNVSIVFLGTYKSTMVQSFISSLPYDL